MVRVLLVLIILCLYCTRSIEVQSLRKFLTLKMAGRSGVVERRLKRKIEDFDDNLEHIVPHRDLSPATLLSTTVVSIRIYLTAL